LVEEEYEKAEMANRATLLVISERLRWVFDPNNNLIYALTALTKSPLFFSAEAKSKVPDWGIKSTLAFG
jgi:hypothetical protein